MRRLRCGPLGAVPKLAQLKNPHGASPRTSSVLDLSGYGVACVGRISLASTLRQVGSVSADLAHIEHHEIVRVAGLTSHHVRLAGGGELHYAYNTRGDLVEIEISSVFVAISKDRRLTVRPLAGQHL